MYQIAWLSSLYWFFGLSTMWRWIYINTTCGENSLLNTGNAKFHYCKPTDGSNCGGSDVVTPVPARDDSCSLNLGKCDSDPCQCMMDEECSDCQNCGCEECKDGYFKKSFGHECVKCTTTIPNCKECKELIYCDK